ncbi:hypothetical protein BC826DRAFT_1032596 [Russula brevipes]|nr:hypothetical protein BC826DRAFT_1032596 [Russula brevipes]
MLSSPAWSLALSWAGPGHAAISKSQCVCYSAPDARTESHLRAELVEGRSPCLVTPLSSRFTRVHLQLAYREFYRSTNLTLCPWQ